MASIGFVLAVTNTGGSETFLLRILRRLDPTYRTFVFVRSNRPGELHEAFVQTGARLIYAPLGYANPMRAWRFRKALRAAQLDALVDFTGVFAAPSITLARTLGVSRRVVFHRRSTYAFKPSLGRRLYASLSRRIIEASATHILSNSRSALEMFHPGRLGLDPRLQVIRNLIDPADLDPTESREAVRKTLGIPDGAFVLLHVGRLNPAKDHPTLLRSVVEVMREDPAVYCVLAGRGTERLQDHEVFGGGGAGPRFRFLGNRTDVGNLYHAADLFVFTSVTEGQPNALLEAALCNLPVVASDIPPIREIVPRGGHPALVQPGNVAGFASAIRACIASQAVRDERRYQTEVRKITAPEYVMPKVLEAIVPTQHDPQRF